MRFKRTICWTEADCQAAERFLLSCVLIANDIETFPFRKKNKSRIFTMTVNAYSGLTAAGEIQSFAFPFQIGKSPASGCPSHIEAIYHTCRRINDSGIRFVGHNYPYDLSWLIRYGLPVANYAYDTMTMWWAFYPELPKSLDFVSSILLDHYQYWKAGRKSDDWEEHLDYAMDDTESTLLNCIILVEQLEGDSNARRNFANAHSRCVVALCLSLRGLDADMAQMAVFEEALKEKAQETLARLRYIVADSEFNPNSAPQKKDLIYKILAARLRGPKGKYVSKFEDASGGAMPLRAMRSEHPIFRRVANAILDALTPAKQLSNVVGLSMFESPRTKRVRFLTSYHGVGTTTTRLSSTASAFGHGGNGQNVRKKYRSFGRADSDSFLLEVDLSAADDVFVSFESQEPKKIELVRSGKDIHATNALIFFPNWTYEGIVTGKKAGDPRVVDPITGVRQITKKVVHGCHYLMAAMTLLMSAQRESIVAAAKELGHEDAGLWPQERLVKFCEEMERDFRMHYPRFKRTGKGSWYTELRDEVLSTGGFTTIFNYYQRFLSSANEDSTLRAIAATAGQANTAGRINMAMEELELGIRTLRFRDGPAPDADDSPRRISVRENGANLRLQTHDSLAANINFRHPRWRDAVSNILHVMSRPVICKGEIVQVGIEAEISVRWAGPESREIKSVEDCEKFLTEQGLW